MGYVYAALAVVGAILFIMSIVVWVYDDTDMFFQTTVSLFASIVCIIAAVQWFDDDEQVSTNPVIDLDNCRYIGAEVYTADDNRTVFIDITSGDGALYAYNGQVDAAAQYMLTLDAKTGEVLVVWQNVH